MRKSWRYDVSLTKVTADVARDNYATPVAEKLQTKSAFAYRNESAAEDLQDLGRLPSSTVLRTLKSEYTKKQFLDNNPVIALSILKRKSSIGRNVIHKIGYDPFFVYFWSSHQVKLYNTQVAEGGCSLAIDATGGVAPKIIHVDGRKSKHLFLYTGTLNCPGGLFPVMRQITECQKNDTASISDWLKKWLQSGANYPTEVVSCTFLWLFEYIRIDTNR